MIHIIRIKRRVFDRLAQAGAVKEKTRGKITERWSSGNETEVSVQVDDSADFRNALIKFYNAGVLEGLNKAESLTKKP